MNESELYQLHYSWIEACQLSDNLSEWEDNFINSLLDQLIKKGSLSHKQIEILERIYADKTD